MSDSSCLIEPSMQKFCSNGLFLIDIFVMADKLSLSEGNYDVPESKGLLWCFLYTIVYARYLDIMLDMVGCLDADL